MGHKFKVTDNSLIGGEREVTDVEAFTPTLENAAECIGLLLKKLVRENVISRHDAIAFAKTGAYDSWGD